MIHIGAREYLISCDAPDCLMEDVHHCHTKRDAVSVFREKGWKACRDGKCLCPRHNNLREEEGC